MYYQDEQQRSQFSNKFISIATNVLSYSSRLENSISVALKPYNLTLPQFNALCVLTAHHPEPVVLKKITEGMIDKSSNTSRLVDKLVEKKLVERQLDLTDRRIVHVLLTETGFALTNQATESLATRLETVLSEVENEDLKKLIADLKILRGSH
jgi:DNA-binding MarR family transcriptional regulator